MAIHTAIYKRVSERLTRLIANRWVETIDGKETSLPETHSLYPRQVVCSEVDDPYWIDLVNTLRRPGDEYDDLELVQRNVNGLLLKRQRRSCSPTGTLAAVSSLSVFAVQLVPN